MKCIMVLSICVWSTVWMLQKRTMSSVEGHLVINGDVLSQRKDALSTSNTFWLVLRMVLQKDGTFLDMQSGSVSTVNSPLSFDAAPASCIGVTLEYSSMETTYDARSMYVMEAPVHPEDTAERRGVFATVFWSKAGTQTVPAPGPSSIELLEKLRIAGFRPRDETVRGDFAEAILPVKLPRAAVQALSRAAQSSSPSSVVAPLALDFKTGRVTLLVGNVPVATSKDVVPTGADSFQHGLERLGFEVIASPQPTAGSSSDNPWVTPAQQASPKTPTWAVGLGVTLGVAAVGIAAFLIVRGRR